MIVRSIRVEGWRCFIDAIEVGPLGDGLNVVHGPNGVGKSSLFMALGRGLFDDHASAAEAIKQLRPWGRDLAPRVTIEIEHDGVAYRVHKQFLDGKRAELARLEGGHYAPKAEGKSADKEVRDMLCAEAFSKRKGHEPQAWGLAQVLWAPQGEIAVGELSGPARQTLQQALGAQVASGQTHAVEARVVELYGASFTAGGKYKSGASAPKVVGLELQLAEVEGRAQKLRDKLGAFDEASRRIEDLHAQSREARGMLEKLESALARAQSRAEVYQRLLADRDTNLQAAEAAKARFEQWDSKIKAAVAARAEVKRWENDLPRLEGAGSALAEEIQLHSKQAEAANQQLDEVKARRAAVVDARQVAALADAFVRADQRAEQTKQLIDRVEAAQSELKDVETQRGEIIAPDAKELQAIQSAARARDHVRLRLEATLMTLNVTPEAQLVVEVVFGESPGRKELSPGQVESIRGAPEVTLRIPGVATVRATGPTGSSDKLQQEWQAATDQFMNQTLRYGTHDVNELQQRADAAQQIDQKIGNARTRLETLLVGQQLDDLRRTLTQARCEIDAILLVQPSWRDAVPSPASLLSAAERVERKFVDDIDVAEANQRTAVEAVRLAGIKLASHEANLKNAQAQLVAAKQQLDKATADGLTDEDRQAKLDDAAVDARAARRTLETLDEKLRSLGNDPREDVKVLEGQLKAIQDEVGETARRLHFEEGKLQTIVAEAPYSGLATEEETFARLKDEIAHDRLVLDAIRLLHEAISRRKREIVESLVGPVCQRAKQTLNRIAGSRFERLEIGETFNLEGIVPRGSADAVPLDQLSGGEREQAYFAVRLALADIAFVGQRQLVVLDDVFTFTDTARLARIVGILQEAAERFQIVMLTCHPERYRGLPNAKFFDLEDIVSHSRAAG